MCHDAPRAHPGGVSALGASATVGYVAGQPGVPGADRLLTFVDLPVTMDPDG